ncbi:unknown protein; 77955-74282 [Arabidopsis thaliana]|nr:cyclin-like protein [Arabidopsis thaliana]AAG52331.1 unknown protein; 77955-74282 [Arabidopsis thaliana]AEE35089.1 cyclin-like protein [Arabidopsis thaliana]|eukprot:NP_849873.1 cyclin-like protein [Arabidopsis thaliana]
MDAYQPPPQYLRPPSGPPPPTDPYHQYYQHQARPPVPPPTQPGGPPAWYSNQFHHPHSPSPPPPPPPQWGPPSPHYPQGQPYSSPAYPPHQPPFNAGANGNSQFPPPSTGAPIPPPYPQANQEWGNPNWGYQQQQGHTPQANSNVEDWAVKAKEWAAANKDQQSQQSAPNQPSGQVYQQQYPTHGYQDFHQQAVPGVSYQQHQQFPVPPTTQPERYPNYATGNESFPGVGLPQENLPTSSAIHQQERLVTHKLCTPSELKLVTLFARKEESGNTTQHEVHISLPDGGGPVHTEQHMQYAYGDQSAAPPSNFSDHNAWQPHTTSGVVYPPIPSSAQSIPQHDSSMAIPPVSGHIMPPYGRFPPPNPQPVGPPYAFGTKPPLHPVAAFMDDSYAASSVPPKKAPVPNWLKEELLKKKADLGRPSSGRFEERESMDDDVLYKPPTKADQPDKKSFSPSNSSDEEEEDEMDAARTTEINMEIKRILTEVLLKVTDELFDEIATKVINEDEAIPKDDSVQHNHKLSSSLLSTADPLHKASAKILVSVEGANTKASSGSPADVLGLASYASDDDDADTDAASDANADENGVESLGVGSRHNVSQQPSTEKLPDPEAMASAKLDPAVGVNANSGKNSKSGLEDYSQMPGSTRKDDEAGSTKISDVSASSGLDDDTSGSRKEHPDRTDSDKDAILDEPHVKNSGVKSDCNLRQDSNKPYGKDLSDEVSTDRSRIVETKGGKEKGDSQNDSKDRMKENDLKSAEKVKGVESNKKSTDPHVKKDSRDVERPHRTNSKEDRGKRKEKEKEEERSRHRRAENSSKDKRRRSPTSNESSDDSKRKSRSRRRSVSPSPVRSRRKRSSPSSDESSDDSKRKSSSKRKNRSPSPGKSRRR